ncbi:MAG TPA: heme exporter protein CcmB [Pseudomonadota bacterium]|jgi:heme exporter protein CcmB|nr:heme exporter protein CcmB [Deltaproteobacteria bacterium]HPH25782.1 heme exporter protein CcmB [Pseudomonadota bacterium]
MSSFVGPPPSFFRQLAMLLWKDVKVELRAGEMVYATLLFSGIIVLLFSFAFLGGTPPTVEVMAGVLWVALSLSGMLGISRSFEREREADTLRALLLAPVERSALYLSKLLSISLLMLLVCCVVVPGLCLLFQMSVGGPGAWLRLLGLLTLGILGFAAVAALFGASLGRARVREVLLPLLVYPLVVPVLLAGARGTYGILYGTPESLADATRWLKFLLAFDCMAIIGGLWLFEPLCATE